MDSRLPRTPPRAGPGDIAAAKEVLRRQVRDARRRRETPAQTRARIDAAVALCADVPTVACYASQADEPDSWPLIDALLSSGVTVLLPVLGRHEDGRPRRHPDWAIHRGRDSLRPGLWGIPEPTTSSLGADALSTAGFIWVPGLAVDTRGHRLGTGGGWYDRALAKAARGTPVGALVRDSEVLDAVPTDSWDRSVNVIVTESRVLWIAE